MTYASFWLTVVSASATASETGVSPSLAASSSAVSPLLSTSSEDAEISEAGDAVEVSTLSTTATGSGVLAAGFSRTERGGFGSGDVKRARVDASVAVS